MTIEIASDLMKSGMSYSEIASSTGWTKSNTAKFCQQAKMRTGEYMGDINALYVEQRWLNEACLMEELVVELGYSMVSIARYIQAMGLSRDRGYLHRSGNKRVWNFKKRHPNSKRSAVKEAFMSKGHKELLANAKKGKFGPESNAWKGGIWRPGAYPRMVAADGVRVYTHRHLAQLSLMRPLSPREHVHHMDMNRSNNDKSNLLVILEKGHNALHRAMSADPKLNQKAWLKDNGIDFHEVK